MDINTKIILWIISLITAVVAIILMTAFIVDEPIRENPITPISVDTSNIQTDEEISVEETTTAPTVDILSDTQNPFTEVTISASDKKDIFADEALYEVYFIAKWSKNTHPNFLPNGPHLSPFVAWTHPRKDAVFSIGEIASDGIEEVAETGATSIIEGELNELKDSGLVFDSTIGKLINAPGSSSSVIKASTSSSYITVISMIAPSPDWFLVAENILLFENNSWVEYLDVDAILLDAGTDSGGEFESEDIDTNPREFIHLFEGAPKNPIGKFAFVRIK